MAGGLCGEYEGRELESSGSVGRRESKTGEGGLRGRRQDGRDGSQKRRGARVRKQEEEQHGRQLEGATVASGGEYKARHCVGGCEMSSECDGARGWARCGKAS